MHQTVLVYTLEKWEMYSPGNSFILNHKWYIVVDRWMRDDMKEDGREYFEISYTEER